MHSPIATAKIGIQRSHWVTLEPVVPEIQELLLRPILEFSAEGPLGHVTTPAWSSYFSSVQSRLGNIVHDLIVGPVEYQIIPQGRLEEVMAAVEELGYDVTCEDFREDSPRWALDKGWRKNVSPDLRKVVTAVGAERGLRVVAGNGDAVTKAVVAVARAYPCARIAVAVPTYEMLWRFWRRFRPRFQEEPLGLYTVREKRHGRVGVGVIGQIPLGEIGGWDLLVLPYGEQTVGDNALRIITSGHFRRILSFTQDRWTRDENINLRLLVVAGSVYPPEKPQVPVTAVMLGTHGTNTAGKFDDPLDKTRKLYWGNARRNRRIAEVAKRCVQKSKKALRTVGIEVPEVVTLVTDAAKTGVAILVETPEHARALSSLLPGWVVWKAWAAGDPPDAKPAVGCGIIATALAAKETVIGAGVLIRATGGPWPLPEIHWPWYGDVDHGVLIDFLDDYHPVAAKNAKAREESYQRAGMTVWAPDEVPAVAKK